MTGPPLTDTRSFREFHGGQCYYTDALFVRPRDVLVSNDELCVCDEVDVDIPAASDNMAADDDVTGSRCTTNSAHE